MQIIHDYVYTIGGAEKVLEELVLAYPDCIITTAFVSSRGLTSSSILSNAKINTSLFISYFAQIKRLIPLLRKLSVFYWLLTRIDTENEHIIVNYTEIRSLLPSKVLRKKYYPYIKYLVLHLSYVKHNKASSENYIRK